MDGDRVPPTVIKITPEEIVFTLDRMWQQLSMYSIQFTPTPEVASLAIVIALWAVESNWGKEMFNFNWIGIPKIDGDQHDYTTRTVKRNISGTVFSIRDTIRAYETIEEGALDYLLWISTRDYSQTWPAIRDGDIQGFVSVLQTLGHFSTVNAKNRMYYLTKVAEKICFEHPTSPDFHAGSTPEEKQLQRHINRTKLLSLISMELWTLMDDTSR